MARHEVDKIYAVIETQHGKEVGLMKGQNGDFFVDCDSFDGETLKYCAKSQIEDWNKDPDLKKQEIGGVLVEFTNRKVISVFK